MNNIEYFNKIRRILFSTFHKGKQGEIDAFSYLEGYRKKLGETSYVGLKAELGFYQKYGREFSLSVGADVGDHTDFSGIYSKKPFRFDVTTNPYYKKLKDYEPLQKSIDAKYKIAVVNNVGDLEELIDINFPFCPDCEQGRLIDIAILLPENYNNAGDCQWTNDQILIGACSYCQYIEEYNRISTHFLRDFKTEIYNTYEAESEKIDYLESIGKEFTLDENEIIMSHCNNVLPYLHKQFDKSIMALGEKSYEMIDPRDGDGYYCYKIRWQKKLELVQEYIFDEYEID